MRYIDSGKRDPSQALGTWINTFVPASVAALRFQTGFFAAKGAAALQAILDSLRERNALVRAIVGSNDAGTGGDDLLQLIDAIGIPRPEAHVGVCAFGAGFFHPKVIHVTRLDGSQAAYVGSANLTDSGVRGMHIEAGILLDSAEGDSVCELSRIANAIDSWFASMREGFFLVQKSGDIERLVADGVLSRQSEQVETRPPSRRSAKGTTPALPKLVPLLDPMFSSTPRRTKAKRARPRSRANEFYFMELSRNRGGSTYQAEVAKTPFLEYFKGQPNARTPVTLTQLRNDGTRIPEERHLINVRSDNYRVEIGAFSGKEYPTGQSRPIVGFRRVARKSYDYILLMPEDAEYSNAEDFLGAFAPNAPRALRRAIVSEQDVRSRWPTCPLL